MSFEARSRLTQQALYGGQKMFHFDNAHLVWYRVLRVDHRGTDYHWMEVPITSTNLYDWKSLDTMKYRVITSMSEDDVLTDEIFEGIETLMRDRLPIELVDMFLYGTNKELQNAAHS